MKTIVEMARQAGIHIYNEHTDKKTEQYKSFVATRDSISRFVELVRADERKECIHAAEVAVSLLNDPIEAIRARK